MRFSRICHDGVLGRGAEDTGRTPRAGSRRYVIVPAKRIAAAGKNGCHDTFVSALGNARGRLGIMIIFGSYVRSLYVYPEDNSSIVTVKDDVVVAIDRYRSFNIVSWNARRAQILYIWSEIAECRK